MTKPSRTSGEAWLERFLSDLPPSGAGVPVFQAKPTPSERKAEEARRASREITEAETEKRRATTARLKAARLRKAAEAQALETGAAPRTNSTRGAKG